MLPSDMRKPENDFPRDNKRNEHSPTTSNQRDISGIEEKGISLYVQW